MLKTISEKMAEVELEIRQEVWLGVRTVAYAWIEVEQDMKQGIQDSEDEQGAIRERGYEWMEAETNRLVKERLYAEADRVLEANTDNPPKKGNKGVRFNG